MMKLNSFCLWCLFDLKHLLIEELIWNRFINFRKSDYFRINEQILDFFLEFLTSFLRLFGHFNRMIIIFLKKIWLSAQIIIHWKEEENSVCITFKWKNITNSEEVIQNDCLKWWLIRIRLSRPKYNFIVSDGKFFGWLSEISIKFNEYSFLNIYEPQI